MLQVPEQGDLIQYPITARRHGHTHHNTSHFPRHPAQISRRSVRAASGVCSWWFESRIRGTLAASRRMPHTPPQIVLVKVAVMVASSSEQTARNTPEGRPVQRGQIPGDKLLETGALEKDTQQHVRALADISSIGLIYKATYPTGGKRNKSCSQAALTSPVNHETNIAFVNPHPERDGAAYNHSLATAPTPLCSLTLISRKPCVKWFCQHIDSTSCKTKQPFSLYPRNKIDWKICGRDLPVQRKQSFGGVILYLLRHLCPVHPSSVSRWLFACVFLRFSLAPPAKGSTLN